MKGTVGFVILLVLIAALALYDLLDAYQDSVTAD